MSIFFRGWRGRGRTYGLLLQRQAPYHLATRHYLFDSSLLSLKQINYNPKLHFWLAHTQSFYTLKANETYNRTERKNKRIQEREYA